MVSTGQVVAVDDGTHIGNVIAGARRIGHETISQLDPVQWSAVATQYSSQVAQFAIGCVGIEVAHVAAHRFEQGTEAFNFMGLPCTTLYRNDAVAAPKSALSEQIVTFPCKARRSPS